MSMIFSFATTCAVTCAAAVAKTATVSYRALKWASTAMQAEMEALEARLNVEPQAFESLGSATHELRTLYRRVRSEAANIPSLRRHADRVAAVISTRSAGLGQFVPQRMQSVMNSGSTIGLENLVRQSRSNYLRCTAEYIGKAVVDSANELGFTRVAADVATGSGRFLSLQNEAGQCVLAQIKRSKSTIKTHFDLTGFSGQSCRDVHERLKAELARRQVHTRTIHSLFHGRAEGMMLSRKRRSAELPAANGSRMQRTRRERRTRRRNATQKA